jgi:hypothetical protein
LRDRITADGGQLADDLIPDRGSPVFGPLVAAGRRVEGQGDASADRYWLVVESVFEGYLLHHGSSRLLDCRDDDVRLLGGDLLYALGLRELAIGTGKWPDYERVRSEFREPGDGLEARALREVKARAASVGLERQLEHALIAFRALPPRPCGQRNNTY